MTTSPLPFIRIGSALAVIALLGSVISYRFARAGDWLPELPNRVGPWEARETPIPAAVLASLGYPKALGREYENPLGESVYVSLVAAGPFENYHDPTVCVPANGFRMTALKVFPLDGTGTSRVRAMIFRRGEQRILMYYWNQSRDGTTDMEARQSTYRDVAARFRTGFGAVALGRQTCIVRVYAGLGRNDVRGRQSQRNVEELSRAVHYALKEAGKQ